MRTRCFQGKCHSNSIINSKTCNLLQMEFSDDANDNDDDDEHRWRCLHCIQKTVETFVKLKMEMNSQTHCHMRCDLFNIFFFVWITFFFTFSRVFFLIRFSSSLFPFIPIRRLSFVDRLNWLNNKWNDMNFRWINSLRITQCASSLSFCCCHSSSPLSFTNLLNEWMRTESLDGCNGCLPLQIESCLAYF